MFYSGGCYFELQRTESYTRKTLERITVSSDENQFNDLADEIRE